MVGSKLNEAHLDREAEKIEESLFLFQWWPSTSKIGDRHIMTCHSGFASNSSETIELENEEHQDGYQACQVAFPFSCYQTELLKHATQVESFQLS